MKSALILFLFIFPAWAHIDPTAADIQIFFDWYKLIIHLQNDIPNMNDYSHTWIDLFIFKNIH